MKLHLKISPRQNFPTQFVSVCRSLIIPLQNLFQVSTHFISDSLKVDFHSPYLLLSITPYWSTSYNKCRSCFHSYQSRTKHQFSPFSISQCTLPSSIHLLMANSSPIINWHFTPYLIYPLYSETYYVPIFPLNREFNQCIYNLWPQK